MKATIILFRITVMLLGMLLTGLAQGAPVIFWQPDATVPGDAVLLAGGGLAKADGIILWRLEDTDAMPDGAQPIDRMTMASHGVAAEVIQPGEASLKFIMPRSFQPGVFAAQVSSGGEKSKAVVLNRPELWFMQPTTLRPGLVQNQAPAGAAVQIIGKDFLLPAAKGAPRIALRRGAGAPWIQVKVTTAEQFSFVAQLPEDLAEGRYELWVSNGFGGAAGWGGPLAIEIKKPEPWPARIFDVKKHFGAKGDDTTDDTAAFQKALAAARENGGGIVYLPWGIYRVSQALVIPPRTVLRGESRDASVLMWPCDEPQAQADFTQAALFGQAPYAIEDLSLIARKVNVLLEDTSFGQGLPPELRRRADAPPPRRRRQTTRLKPR
jgi:hypothetical protein